MYKIPWYVINALNSVTKRRMRIEWSNDRFATVEGEVDAYDSEWTCDATSQVRWSGKCSIVRADPRINHVTTWMRAFLEIKGMRSKWWRIPMGVYRIYDMTVSDIFTDLTLDGLEAVVRDYTFHVPRTFPVKPSDGREGTVRRLIQEAIPGATLHWLVPPGAKLAKVTVDRDRWSLIDGDQNSKSIAASLAADCFANRVGEFVMQETPIETIDPVWEITVDAGVKVSSATSLSRENMKNVWTVWAEPGGKKKTIGPVTVWDSDPGSSTYAGDNPLRFGAKGSSAFGVVPGYYQNPLLKKTQECAKVGRKRLALSLASRRNVKITSIFNPTLDAGDCLALIPDGSKHLEKFIVENVSYRIDDAATDIQMRTQGPPAFAEGPEDEGTL